ncbi:MAG: class I SAM-dependent methyltransferase [Actinomycetota bacterium]
MGDSVAFDRAAEYYDRTRGLTAEGMRKTIDLLAGELRGRGRVLEVGVGTGQLALPLHEVGIPVVGLDLARPMMDKLVEKAGGRSRLPLIQADATRIPIRDRAFGGAYLRWVLHLIPSWRDAVAEMARVVRPGGVLLTSIGGYGGPRSEIQERFAELTGVSIDPPGLTWAGYDQLDETATVLGLVRRDLPPISEMERDGLGVFIDGIADNAYSWTWKVEDPDLFARTAAEVRRWAEERYGPLGRVSLEECEMVWRAYDVPA